MADPQLAPASNPSSGTPPPLSMDDYRQLYQMSLSSDAGDRAQAASLAQKMTPAEQQTFFAFQQRQHPNAGEVTRTDNTLGGLPPELAALGIANVGRVAAAARPYLPALPTVRRAASGTLSTAGELLDNPVAQWITYRAPILGKFLKRAADTIGETEAAATPAATAAPAAPPSATSVAGTAADVTPSAAAPAPAPPPAPLPRYTTHDVIAIKSLMDQGVSQDEAIAVVAKVRAMGDAAMLSGPEEAQLAAWIGDGVPPAKAIERLQAMRRMNKTYPITSVLPK